ncbi:unnamed protein product [Pylaiella littoralis]
MVQQLPCMFVTWVGYLPPVKPWAAATSWGGVRLLVTSSRRCPQLNRGGTEFPELATLSATTSWCMVFWVDFIRIKFTAPNLFARNKQALRTEPWRAPQSRALRGLDCRLRSRRDATREKSSICCDRNT